MNSILKMDLLRLKKQKNYYTLPIKHFVFGLRKVRLVVLGLHPTSGDIILKTLKEFLMAVLLLLKNKKYVTVEFLPQNKWMTLKDKRIFLDTNTLRTSWLQTLVLGLIGKEKVLKPFWNNQCKEISQRLWLPTEIDFVGSPLTFWNTSSQSMESNSWFSMKKMENQQVKTLQKTLYPLYISTPVKKWEGEGIRAKKIRLYPTLEQKKILREWMRARRYVYNKVLASINNGEKINSFELRNKYVTSKTRDGKNNPLIKEWEKKTPKDIRNGAIRDLIKNYKVCFSNKKNKNKNFKMKFCSVRDTPSIEIPNTSISIKENKIFIFKTFLKSGIKTGKKQLDNLDIKYYCRLQIVNNEWFLIVPYKKEIPQDTVDLRHDFCALDPGTRTFQTIYSPELCLQIKVNKDKIKSYSNKSDKFDSLRKKKKITRKRHKRRKRKIYSKISNLIDDMHFKTINYLTKTFKLVIIPVFQTKNIAMKSNNKYLNRDLMLMKHYSFRTRLQANGSLNKCHIDVCTEEYTSKTCGACGLLNNVGKSEIYNCFKCKTVIDRDINGARNIAIKRLSEYKSYKKNKEKVKKNINIITL